VFRIIKKFQGALTHVNIPLFLHSKSYKNMQNQFIVLLRGINVGGRNKIKMADLRDLLNQAGFENVQTYIQSGNVILEAKKWNEDEISARVKAVIANHYGYDIAVMALSVSDFQDVIKNNPFPNVPESEYKALVVTLLSDLPNLDNLPFLHERKQESEQMEIIHKAFYLYCPNGYRNTKMSNAMLEKKLEVRATTRNWRSMLKILDMVIS